MCGAAAQVPHKAQLCHLLSLQHQLLLLQLATHSALSDVSGVSDACDAAKCLLIYLFVRDAKMEGPLADETGLAHCSKRDHLKQRSCTGLKLVTTRNKKNPTY